MKRQLAQATTRRKNASQNDDIICSILSRREDITASSPDVPDASYERYTRC